MAASTPTTKRESSPAAASTPPPPVIGKAGRYTVFITPPSTPKPPQKSAESPKTPATPPVQAPPQQFQKPSSTAVQSSAGFGFFWNAIAKVQEGNSLLICWGCARHSLSVGVSEVLVWVGSRKVVRRTRRNCSLLSGLVSFALPFLVVWGFGLNDRFSFALEMDDSIVGRNGGMTDAILCDLHSTVDEYLADLLGLDQSKYQWALNDYYETKGMYSLKDDDLEKSDGTDSRSFCPDCMLA
ncbi:hypothetical protein ACLOJK_030680 [Asimina triloba]